MQVKKNGMKLMKDTASLTNALIENIGVEGGLKEGGMFCELMWTDRTLWLITRVISDKEFFAARVQTTMRNWTEGTEYPVTAENGAIVCEDGSECYFRFTYNNWRRADVQWFDGFMNGMTKEFFKDTGNLYNDIGRAVIKFCRTKPTKRVHLAFGVETGYRDPSF